MRRRAGFTLIELLIVMAIIATLMGVLTPTATGAMKKARATKIAVQLRNFEQGVEQYILATLPDSDDVGNLTDASVTNAGFAEDIDTSTKNLEATAGTDKITITVTATVTDSTLAQLVKGTLGETFSGGSQGTITVNNNVITITKDIEAFWW